MTTATQWEVPETLMNGERIPEEHRLLLQSRLFDLSGKWPWICCFEWAPHKCLTPKVWAELSDEQRSLVEEWMTNHAREIRETTVWNRTALLHYPAAEPSSLVLSSRDQVELMVRNEWVRHSEEILITVEGVTDPAIAERKFREWLTDMAEVGVDPEPQLTGDEE